MAKTIQIADNLANASSSWVRAPGRPNVGVSHHQALFRAIGTMGGGSYQLQGTPDGGTTIIDLGSPITVTLKSSIVFIPEGWDVRATGSGGTANSVDCFVDY